MGLGTKIGGFYMGSVMVRGYEGFDFMRAAEWAREG